MEATLLPGEAGAANLLNFLGVLRGRQRRLVCTAAAKSSLRAAFHKISDHSGTPCSSMPLALVREVLEEPPKGVPEELLQEVVRLAPAYPGADGGSADVVALLDSALEPQPGVLARLRPPLWGVVLVVWFFVAPLVYCLMAHWSFLDACYFAAMTMSTVGVHDVELDNVALKAVSVVYVAVASLLLTCTVASCLRAMLVKYEATLLEAVFAPNRVRAIPGSKEELQRPTPDNARRRLIAALVVCLAAVPVVIVGVAVIAYFVTEPRPSFWDALYWAIATSTMIGNGRAEFVPSKGLSLGVVLTAVPCCVAAVMKAGEAFVRIRAGHVEAELRHRALPLDILAGLDATGAGITKADFLCAALLAADRVPERDVWQILQEFHRLDPAGFGVVRGAQLASLRQKVAHDLEAEISAEEVLGTCGASTMAGLEEYRHYGSGFSTTAMTLPPSEGDWPAREAPGGWSQQQLLEKLHQHVLDAQQRLDARDAELSERLHGQSRVEAALQEALAQQKCLQMETQLVERLRSEAEARHLREQERRAEAEGRGWELEAKRQEAERKAEDAAMRLQEMERRCREAEQQQACTVQLLQEAQSRSRAFEHRAEDLEKAYAGLAQRLAEAEQQLLQAGVEKQALASRCEELQAKHQAELRKAVVELEAVVKDHRELKERFARRRPSSLGTLAHLPLRDAFDRGTIRASADPKGAWHPSGLLVGKAREHARFVEAVARDLEDRCTPMPFPAGSPPGWV